MCDTNTFEEAVKVNLAWNRRVTLSVLESPRCSKVGEKGYNINGAAENFRVLFKIPCFFSLLWFKTLFLKVWGFSFKHRAGGTTSKPPEGNALMHIEYSKSRDFCSRPSFFFPTNAIYRPTLSFFQSTKMCESGFFPPSSSVFDKEKIFLLKRCFCVGRLMLCLLAPQLFSLLSFFTFTVGNFCDSLCKAW